MSCLHQLKTYSPYCLYRGVLVVPSLSVLRPTAGTEISCPPHPPLSPRGTRNAVLVVIVIVVLDSAFPFIFSGGQFSEIRLLQHKDNLH